MMSQAEELIADMEILLGQGVHSLGSTLDLVIVQVLTAPSLGLIAVSVITPIIMYSLVTMLDLVILQAPRTRLSDLLELRIPLR